MKDTDKRIEDALNEFLTKDPTRKVSGLKRQTFKVKDKIAKIDYQIERHRSAIRKLEHQKQDLIAHTSKLNRKISEI